MSMARSPHRKQHRFPVKPITYKAQVGGNKGGRAGTKYRKRHPRCLALPGTPNGVCLGYAQKVARDGVVIRCRCGRHNQESA